jgi:hypothetical protein
MSKRVYVVCYEMEDDSDPKAKIWTLSEDPNNTGWETDSGCEGYGLTKEQAEYYAKCINGVAN